MIRWRWPEPMMRLYLLGKSNRGHPIFDHIFSSCLSPLQSLASINQSISHFSIIFYMDMIAIVSIAINLVSILFIEYCYIWFSWWLVIVALYRNVTEIMLYGCGKDLPSMSLLAKNANTIKLMLQLICSKYFKRWKFLRAIDYSLRFSCPKTDVSSWTYLNFPFIFYFYFFFGGEVVVEGQIFSLSD